MIIPSRDGDSRTAINYADTLWTFLDASTDRKERSETTTALADVGKALFTIISAKVHCAVREVVRDANKDIDKKPLDGLLLDSAALRVEGFTR